MASAGPSAAADTAEVPARREFPELQLSVLRLKSYAPFIACGADVTAFLGRRVALVVDAACGDVLALCEDKMHELSAFIQQLEALLGAFDSAVGRRPPVNSPLEGRVRIEVAFIPAAGLAHHGIAGIAVGPAFVASSLASFATAAPNIHHVFCYESCRNYIFPEDFTAIFDYHCLESADSWGWVNQGFVNILGCLLLSDVPRIPVFRSACASHTGEESSGGGTAVVAASGASIGFDYFGSDAAAFQDSMEADVRACTASELAWDDVFLHDRLPWNKARSLDNLYSGILSCLWRAHGRATFLRRWFTGAMPLLLGRCPASKEDVELARDNFFLAACFAAGADLSDWFICTLRWPVTASTRDALETMLAAAAADGAATSEA